VTHYWFRPKSFGYGATPMTWEGWALTIGGGVAAASCFVYGATRLHAGANGAASWPALLAGVVIVAAVSLVAKIKTDGAWRWRGGADKAPN